MESMIPRERVEITPGALHVPDWLTEEQQRRLVDAWREWAPSGEQLGMRHTVLPSGGQMSVQTVCLGWHWEPYRYVRSAGGVPVAGFPAWLASSRAPASRSPTATVTPRPRTSPTVR
jgi:alkylated DNA repair protein (DNA oxidative demethylase)